MQPLPDLRKVPRNATLGVSREVVCVCVCMQIRTTAKMVT